MFVGAFGDAADEIAIGPVRCAPFMTFDSLLFSDQDLVMKGAAFLSELLVTGAAGSKLLYLVFALRPSSPRTRSSQRSCLGSWKGSSRTSPNSSQLQRGFNDSVKRIAWDLCQALPAWRVLVLTSGKVCSP